jgi:hypothetical protein
MSPEFLLKVAAVLDETAKIIDDHAVEKTAAVKRARDEAMKSLSDKYTEATGEDIPEEVFAKLSSSGEDVVTTVRQMLEKTAGSTGVESLGRSSEKSASQQPMNKKEAAAAAWEKFGNYINS